MLVWQGPENNEWIGELSAALAAGRDLPAPPAGAPGPFGLADRGRARELLISGGFCGIEVRGLREPMWFGTGAENAHTFVLGLQGWMLHGLDGNRRDQALENLRTTVTAHDTGHGVFYQSATWLIHATRT